VVGQKRLLADLEVLGARFPRFSIFIGPVGSGRKLIVQKVAKQLQANLVTLETKVDAIREAIDMAYKQKHPVVYLIADADNMNIAAKNALLKITEEPPRQAYFIMTLTDIGNTLPTLISRGTVFHLAPYTEQELREYAERYDVGDDQTLDILVNVCITPGEIDQLVGTDILGFYEYVKKVVDNIGKVSGPNAFKIAQALKFKDGEPGYDVIFFLRTVIYYYHKQALAMEGDPLQLFKSISTTSECLRAMGYNGINRRSLFDLWILDMRQIWRG
jgi:hypothetical protein